MFPNDRRQTLGEEIANTISHGLGAAGALAAAPILIIAAVRQGDAAFIAGAAVFAATMCLLYLASTIYHALPENRAKRLFNVLDHSAIYLLIAGTYTPFALGALRGPWGWTLFGLVWGMALLGVGLKASKRLNRPAVSTGLYLAMGWLVIIAVKPLLELVPTGGLWWLVAGGWPIPAAWSSSSSTTAGATATSSGTCSCWRARCAISLRCFGMRRRGATGHPCQQAPRAGAFLRPR